MARGINKVILIGNLGRDPDKRAMPSGKTVVNATLATSENWKDRQTGENRENTEWHRVVFFDKLGDIAGQYLRKGSKVFVEGRLQTRKWQDRNGQDRYTTEVIATDMQMLDSKGGGATSYDNDDPGFGAEDYTARDNDSPSTSQNTAPRKDTPQFDEDFDDDIPF